MELTDKDRDENMVDAGVCVVDDGNTSKWRLDDPTILQRERDERRLKVKEEKLRVLRQKRLQKVFFLTFSSCLIALLIKNTIIYSRLDKPLGGRFQYFRQYHVSTVLLPWLSSKLSL